jgi:uncharacterized protein with NAD-binding domain and iron-sulfur cluster
MTAKHRPIRVAIVGGGCAAMTAAFELTRPELEGRYEVTVYQLGWRLGGKGASGRGASGRIEEHGLHLWMGWYENAFRLMRACYEELGRDPRSCPIATWDQAFVPAPVTGVMEQTRDGVWMPFASILPPTEGLPGDVVAGHRRFTPRDYMMRTAALLRTLFEIVWRQQMEDGVASRFSEGARDAPPQSLVVDTIAQLLGYGELATLAGLVQAVAFVEPMLEALGRYPQNLVLRLLDAIGAGARQLLEARLANDPALRRVWQIIDLTLATLRGEVRFGVTTDPRGFDAVDEYDCREWLLLNGASDSSVDSGFVRGLYDLGFSYEDGDASRPRISAAQGLRSMVRAFFTYRGAFFWRMQAGMGDVVFAPLYEVLARRGVHFAFFHRLQNVRLSDTRRVREDSPHVEALEFDVQAEVVGSAPYQPLIDVHGLPCWPSAPDWHQIVDGARLAREAVDFESFWDRRCVRRRVLRVIDDFDLVVLGVGLGAVPYVCRELIARDARWRAMVEHVKTVATQAFQLWLHADSRELGWTERTVAVSGFVEPFDTWADMTHLLPRERWTRSPRGLAYFCSVLPDLDLPADDPRYLHLQRAVVRQNVVRFLNRDVVHLWPGSQRVPGEFRWDLLAQPEDDAAPPATGEERIDSQFLTANVNPSDRYTLSLPGSAAYRISPLDALYDNLTVAGDWTDCGFNAGCVEAAVMSGRLAAHAISKTPALEDIVGYDHP